jgi:hypothetical protein
MFILDNPSGRWSIKISGCNYPVWETVNNRDHIITVKTASSYYKIGLVSLIKSKGDLAECNKIEENIRVLVMNVSPGLERTIRPMLALRQTFP